VAIHSLACVEIGLLSPLVEAVHLQRPDPDRAPGDERSLQLERLLRVAAACAQRGKIEQDRAGIGGGGGRMGQHQHVGNAGVAAHFERGEREPVLVQAGRKAQRLSLADGGAVGGRGAGRDRPQRAVRPGLLGQRGVQPDAVEQRQSVRTPLEQATAQINRRAGNRADFDRLHGGGQRHRHQAGQRQPKRLVVHLPAVFVQRLPFSPVEVLPGGAHAVMLRQRVGRRFGGQRD